LQGIKSDRSACNTDPPLAPTLPEKQMKLSKLFLTSAIQPTHTDLDQALCPESLPISTLKTFIYSCRKAENSKLKSKSLARLKTSKTFRFNRRVATIIKFRCFTGSWMDCLNVWTKRNSVIIVAISCFVNILTFRKDFSCVTSW